MFSLACVLISVASFANSKVVKKASIGLVTKPVIVKEIKVYCNGTYKGTISCNSCTTQQLVNAANAMCGAN